MYFFGWDDRLELRGWYLSWWKLVVMVLRLILRINESESDGWTMCKRFVIENWWFNEGVIGNEEGKWLLLT